jgi:hypothetical protein
MNAIIVSARLYTLGSGWDQLVMNTSCIAILSEPHILASYPPLLVSRRIRRNLYNHMFAVESK